VTDGEYDMQELADIVHSSAAISQATKERVPIGQPGQRLSGKHYKVDSKKASSILELVSPTLESTIVELVEQLLEIEKA
jgi:hypothetical protein